MDKIFTLVIAMILGCYLYNRFFVGWSDVCRLRLCWEWLPFSGLQSRGLHANPALTLVCTPWHRRFLEKQH